MRHFGGPTRKPSSRRLGRPAVKGCAVVSVALLENLALGGLGGWDASVPIFDFGGLLENLAPGGWGGWGAKGVCVHFGGPTRKPSSQRLGRPGVLTWNLVISVTY